MSKKLPVIVGSLWRHRKNGRIVRVVEVTAGGTVHWEAADENRKPSYGQRNPYDWPYIFEPHHQEN